MKIKVCIKDPDGFSEAVKEYVDEQLKKLDLPKDEADELREMKEQKVDDALSLWVSYGEYATLEFDTETGKAIVLTKTQAGL